MYSFVDNEEQAKNRLEVQIFFFTINHLFDCIVSLFIMPQNQLLDVSFAECWSPSLFSLQ